MAKNFIKSLIINGIKYYLSFFWKNEKKISIFIMSYIIQLTLKLLL